MTFTICRRSLFPSRSTGDEGFRANKERTGFIIHPNKGVIPMWLAHLYILMDGGPDILFKPKVKPHLNQWFWKKLRWAGVGLSCLVKTYLEVNDRCLTSLRSSSSNLKVNQSWPPTVPGCFLTHLYPCTRFCPGSNKTVQNQSSPFAFGCDAEASHKTGIYGNFMMKQVVNYVMNLELFANISAGSQGWINGQ